MIAHFGMTVALSSSDTARNLPLWQMSESARRRHPPLGKFSFRRASMLSTISVPRWVVRGTDPFEAARREFQKAFGAPANGQRSANRGYAPLSVWEDQQQLHIDVDLPGLQPADVDVTVEDGKLSIRGERKPAEGAQGRYDERAYGRFERVIALADTIDQGSVEAQLRDGVLHVTLSKKPEVQPQRVVVKYSGEQPAANSTPVPGNQN